MSQKKDGKSKIILVVDDEPDICEAMQLALGMEGYDCRAALERDDALRLSSDSRPSVILLDYRMPGLDAAEFVAQLRSQKVSAPVILMTAGKDPGETARKLGLQYHLAKPFELDDLLTMVKKCAETQEGIADDGPGAAAV